MLTPQDELLCHQLPTTFDHVQQSDLRWTERVVMYGFDTTGEVSVMTGMARYPNRNLIDAYAMITIGDRAHTVRLSRQIDDRYDGLGSWQVGPFTYEIVEPLRKVRATLADNEHGIRLQLEFDAQFPAYEQEPAFFRTRGRVREDARRYYQNGRVSGWLEVEGARIEIDPATWWFGRDHSWGTRHGGGGGAINEGGGILQPSEIPDGVLYYMGIFQFEDELVHFAQRETPEGHRWHFEGTVLSPLGSDAQPQPVRDAGHELTFRDDFRIVSGGTFSIVDAAGKTREFTITPVSDFWPGLAGYDLYRDYASGVWKGERWSDSFVADLTDTADLKQVSMLSETFCRVETDGKVGYGLVEMVFMGRNEKYGYEGY
ncbi:hypothetical protein [Nocardia sp. NPDC056100]|uniref:DUF7064 domain-containing protein n=1 Tax=Nocardia sp. NPDC056100 TaxID=3345712 RepID=UPI0035D84058